MWGFLNELIIYSTQSDVPTGEAHVFCIHSVRSPVLRLIYGFITIIAEGQLHHCMTQASLRGVDRISRCVPGEHYISGSSCLINDNVQILEPKAEKKTTIILCLPSFIVINHD